MLASVTRPECRYEPDPLNRVCSSPNGCLSTADDLSSGQAQSSLLARHPFITPRRCCFPTCGYGSDCWSTSHPCYTDDYQVSDDEFRVRVARRLIGASADGWLDGYLL